jgi:hypothetical protein
MTTPAKVTLAENGVINVTAETLLDKAVKYTKDIGFPIVLSGVLVWIGYGWGERLIKSHEVFLIKTTESIERIEIILERIEGRLLEHDRPE